MSRMSSYQTTIEHYERGRTVVDLSMAIVVVDLDTTLRLSRGIGTGTIAQER
jgi:hypothetical protein